MRKLVLRVLASAILAAPACAPPAEKPPASEAAPAAPAAPAAGLASVRDDNSQQDVVKIAAASPDHTTLVAAVKAAGLLDVLASPGPYTVFAPNNAAFDKLPAGTVDNLLKPENNGQLRRVLYHHVMTSVYEVAELQDGQVLSMVDGAPATVSKKGSDTYLGDAKIIGTARASNGIVHIVDGVILPAK
jgi:uncharacterized surface protein with fasciclin (FAS1) repeats